MIRWKDANPEESWFWAFQQVLTGAPPPTTVRTAHLVGGPIFEAGIHFQQPRQVDDMSLEDNDDSIDTDPTEERRSENIAGGGGSV